MRYKTRRKKELKERAEKTTHVMSGPPPIQKHAPGEALPERVPIRVDGRTVRHIRVSKLERNLDDYAKEFRMTVPQLKELIATRRYVPEPAPKPVEGRPPSWYQSDNYSSQFMEFL